MLNIQETGESQNALLHFKRAAGDTNIFRSKVKVYDTDGSLQFDYDDITTTIIFDSNKVTISIMWEEAGMEQESFRKQNLYGVYYASYNKMRYDNQKLTIYADKLIEMEYSGDY